MSNLIDNQMTIGESIEILECLLGDRETPYTDEQCKDKEFIDAKYDEAIRMAIKALQCTMYGDAISRQQAITALRALSDEDGYINVPHEVVTDVVRGLPPVQAKQGQTAHSEQPKTDKFGVKTGETREDCISRQAAIDAMANTLWHYPNECYRNLNEYEFAKGLAELGLKSVPSAHERKTGKWTINDCHAAVYKYHCSACGANHRARYDFCPSCGADMREECEDAIN